jgi:hypothetical protein
MCTSQSDLDGIRDWINKNGGGDAARMHRPALDELQRRVKSLRMAASDYARMGKDFPIYGSRGLDERLDGIAEMLTDALCRPAGETGVAGYVPDPGERYMGEGASADESTFWTLYYGYDPAEDEYHVTDVRGYLDDRKITADEVLLHVHHYPDWQARMAATCAEHHEASLRTSASE